MNTYVLQVNALHRAPITEEAPNNEEDRMTQPGDISQALSSTPSMLAQGALRWNRHSVRDRGYAGNQHPLTNADPATGAVKCPSCKQETATLPPQCGIIHHRYTQPLGDRLTALDPFHTGRHGDSFYRNEHICWP